MTPTRNTWRAMYVAVAALALISCGGGGGGGGEASPPPAANEPPPPPPPSPQPTGLSGRLWHNNYALDARSGTQIASPAGAMPSLASIDKYVEPWPDGTQYAKTHWDVVAKTTDLDLVDMASGTTLRGVVAPGYLRNVRPSPVDKNIVMATLGDDTVSPADTVFIDVAAVQVLKRFSADDPVNWLPDGRYLRIHADGTLHAATVSGAEQQVGRVDPPANHVVQDLWVNRQASKIALRVRHDVDPVDETDVWLANMDGSGLERLTQTKMTAYARWSPDGNHIAFDVDTGHVCTGAGCMGTCELWYVPSTARNVRALAASGDALRFSVKNEQGGTQTLGCDLLAWTD